MKKFSLTCILQLLFSIVLCFVVYYLVCNKGLSEFIIWIFILPVLQICSTLIYLDVLSNMDKCNLNEYPSINYLNNALRKLLRNPKVNKNAILEICYAINKCNGQFQDDVKQELIKNNIFFSEK